MNKSVLNAIGYSVAATIGGIIGIVGANYYNLKHTPEEKIIKLNLAREDYNKSLETFRKEKHESEEALEKLKRTKQTYQDEIRPELESKIRQEFKDYIDKADEKYAESARNKEIADLKLELAKSYAKGSNIVVELGKRS